MTDICLGFEVHQPIRINGNFKEERRKGKKAENPSNIYFDNKQNRSILKRVIKKSYLPANETILRSIDDFKGGRKEFKVVYSISGVLVEQLRRWAPEVLDSFRNLAESGCVEFLDQTYYHSLSSLFSDEREDFIDQVNFHRHLMKDVFCQEPKVFENTEFIYNNSIARTLEGMGYLGVFTEGAERVLQGRSTNYVYRAVNKGIPVLLRNYRLSDDIAFRFSERSWPGWPLTSEKYAATLSAESGQCICIFIDYETFGEHQWPETGILDFLRWLPGRILEYENLQFKTATELVACHPPVDEVDVHDFDTVSWADVERSTSAWLGNDMQRTCYHALRRMEHYVKKTHSEELIEVWRLLQVSDHYYYMYTRPGASRLVHGYFSSQPPEKVFWAFMRILSDFYKRVAERLEGSERTSLHILRVIPPDKAFHFYEKGCYINLSAHSLDELNEALRLASDDSILFHNMRGHFEKWIRETLGDTELAEEVGKVKGKNAIQLRQVLRDCVDQRLRDLRTEKS